MNEQKYILRVTYIIKARAQTEDFRDWYDFADWLKQHNIRESVVGIKEWKYVPLPTSL